MMVDPREWDAEQLAAWQRGTRAATAAAAEARTSMAAAIAAEKNPIARQVLQGLADHIARQPQESEDAILLSMQRTHLLGHDPGRQGDADEHLARRRGDVDLAGRQASAPAQRSRARGSRRVPQPEVPAALDRLPGLQ